MDSETSAPPSVPDETSRALDNRSDVPAELKSLQHGEIWTPEVTQRVTTLVVLMIVTLVGNTAVIVRLAGHRLCCFSRRFRRGRSAAAAISSSNPPSRVNVFIVNLAVGDLTVCCFTMTTEVLFVVFEKAWLLGPVACRLLLYIQVPCATGCVVECRICNQEVAGSNLGRGYFAQSIKFIISVAHCRLDFTRFAPRSTQPSIPPGSVNEYLLRLGRQRQVYGSFRLRMNVCGCAGKTVRSIENTCHT